MNKPKVDILELFSEQKRNDTYLKVAAPMVRYSKLEFRKLLRKYKTQLCFTPMIIADSFCRSEEARNSEFTTSLDDSPLIAQFAAKNSIEFQTAAQLIYPFVDGVDINCGCPQSWAISKCYGCALLRKPEIIEDMIKAVRRVLPNEFSCSVKMRILQKGDVKKTIDLCRQLENCGASFLTIHGRTPRQKSSELVDVDAIAEIKKSTGIPLIYNGDIKSLADADEAYKKTKCDGVMSARGILLNPSLYAGELYTTTECLKDWISMGAAADTKISFQCFHHHLTFMMEKQLKKRVRCHFNNFNKKNQIFEFMNSFYKIELDNSPDLINYNLNMLPCNYNLEICDKYNTIIGKSSNNFEETNWNESNDGKYFLEHKEKNKCSDFDDDQLSFMGCSIFE